VPRINIYITADLEERLKAYRQREWSGHHSLSAIVQKAVREFLDREEAIQEKIVREERERQPK